MQGENEMKNSDKEAIEYINCKIPLCLYEADWQEPSKKDIEILRDIISNGPEYYSEYSSEYDKTYFQAFADGKPAPEGGWDYEELAGCARQDPMDALEIAHEHLVRVVMTIGGPHVELQFRVNNDGGLKSARAVYDDFEMDISQDTGESLWWHFRHNVDLKPQNTDGPTD